MTSNNMVNIYVGPKRKLWVLHEAVVCERSEYFAKAFQGKFAEGIAKEIWMEEVDPVVFAMLVDWLYGVPLRRLEDLNAYELSVYCSSPTGESPDISLLYCKLYSIGDVAARGRV